MKNFLWVSFLVLMATPAWGANYYVRQSGLGTGAGNDSSNAQSISNFNTGAVAGDVALLLGNFTTAPSPKNSGTISLPIVYRSAYASTGAVTVTANILTGSVASDADSFVTWRDFTVVGSVVLGGVTRTSRWQVRNLKVSNGKVGLTNATDCHLDSIYCLRTDGVPYLFQMQRYDDILADTLAKACIRDTLRNSSFSMTTTTDAGGAGVNLFMGYENVYENSRFIITTGSTSYGSVRLARICHTVRGHMSDCYFQGVNNMSAGGQDEPMGWTMKDGVKLFTVLRDTVIQQGNSLTTSPSINFGQDESNNGVNPGEEIGGNSIKFSYFRNETDATWPAQWGSGFDGDSVVGNTFVAKASCAESFYNAGDPVMLSSVRTIVKNNCFVTFDANLPAFLMDYGEAVTRSVDFSNNIFYAPNAVAANYRAAAVGFGSPDDWATSAVGPVGNDYNLAWTPKATTALTLYMHESCCGYERVPWTNWRGNNHALDANSLWARPIFTDSTLAAFDAHPLVGTAALFGIDGYVGPFPYTAGAQAGRILYVATDGSAANTGLSIAQAWTMAKANDSLVAGDVCLIRPGTYSTMISPASSGTSIDYPITFIGNLSRPDNTIFTGNFTSAKSYISIKGVGFTGSVSFVGTMASPATRDSLISCQAIGVTMTRALGCYVGGCEFSGTFSGTGANTIGRFLSYSSLNQFEDNGWRYEASDDSLTRTTFFLKDSSNTNTFSRDTVYAGLVSGHAFKAFLVDTSSKGPSKENVWSHCTYVSNSGGYWGRDSLVGGRIEFTVFFARDSAAVQVKGANRLTFQNNTVFSNKGPGMVFASANPTNSTFLQNVYVTRAYPASCSALPLYRGTAMVAFSLATNIGSDYNYFAPGVANRSVSVGGNCYYQTDWASSSSNDLHSRASVFSGDMFMDPRWNHLDLRPARSSPLKDTQHLYTTTGYCGALAPVN